MLKFNDFINEAKKKETDECWPAQAGKAKMSEADVDESGLRMAAHAAHKEGKKEFEFQGKSYPVKVQKEEAELNEGAFVGGPEHTRPEWIGGHNSKTSKDIRIALVKAGHEHDDHGDQTKSNTHYIGMKTKEGHDALLKIKKEKNLPEHPYGTIGHSRSGHTGKAKKEDLPTHVTHDKKSSYMKEEVEAIDEISKDLALRYLDKAPRSARIHGQLASEFKKTAERKRNPGLKAALEKSGQKYQRKAWNREDSIKRAIKKVAKEEVQIDEGKMKDIYTSMMMHADKKGYKSHKEFTPADYDTVGKEHGISGKELAIVAGHKTAAQVTKEEVQIDEGKMKDIYTDMMHHATKKGYSSHKEFTPADYDTVGKQHGISGKELAVLAGHKTAQQASTHFKKPVQKGHEMDRAKALAHRGMMSVKEEAALIAELSKKTLGSYAQKAMKDSNQRKDDWSHEDHAPYEDEDDNETEKGRDTRKIENRDKGVKTAIKKLAKEEVEVELEEATTRKDFQMVADLIKGHESAEKRKELAHHHAEIFKKQNPRFDHAKFMKAAGVNEGEMCEDEMRFPKDGWSQNDSMAKPVKSSDAMKQHSHYFSKVTKLDPKTGNPVKEEVSAEMSPYLKATLQVMDEGKIDEGKMKDIYTDMMDHATKKGYSSHKQFTPTDYETVGKQHGISGKELAVLAGHKTAQQADTHFKKPVEPGKGMDRAKALAQRSMQSLSKEEVERIEEKLTQIDELSKKTLGSYAHKATDDAQDKAHDAYDSGTPTRHELEIQGGKNNQGKYGHKPLQNRLTGLARASKKLGDKGIGKDVEKSVAHHLKQRYHYDNMDDGKASRSDDAALRQSSKAHEKIHKASGVKEEVSQEMSPYVKGTLAVMDEGKIDDLRDAQKLRQASQSAYDPKFKPDTSHPHINLVKGTAYGGANQKDDETDEKPDDETKEKRGRGRPAGSKSGARV